MTQRAAWLILILATLSPLAHAEGSGHGSAGEGDGAERPKTVRRAPVKAAPKTPPPQIPEAPIPYSRLIATSPDTPLPADVAKALTPSPAVQPPSDPAPVAATQPLPPPPVIVVEAAPLPPPAVAATDIDLRCETRTMRGDKVISSGVFYIHLVPSPVFPDQHASFQFRFVDPQHVSLVRDTVCLDTLCQAKVSAQAYALVNRVDGRDALRITLDRTRGAFYAEAVDKGLAGSSHLGEQGWCSPQPAVATPLF